MDEEGRIHGHLDPPLSDRGRMKARTIANGFKGKKVSKVYSSPRQRSLETAKMIGNATGASVEVRNELEPWKLGSISGAKAGAIKPLLDWFSSRPDRPVPGGEAKNDVLKRYAKFLKGVKDGEVIVGHSQHSLAHDYASKGGDASKVPMVGGRAGEIRTIEVRG